MSISNTKVSVVIVNWNTCQLLVQCLRSLSKTSFTRQLEVIVVDNASIDSSCSVVERDFPDVILIRNSDNLGFCKATNQGMEVASGNYLLLLNSDTVVEYDTIEKSVEFAEDNNEIGIIGCKLTYPDGSFQGSCFRFPGIWGSLSSSLWLSKFFPNSDIFNGERYGNREWTEPKDVDCVMGSFMLIKRKVVEGIGFLDTDYFMYAEETDFCYRAKRTGWKIFYYPLVEIIHHHSGSQKNWNDTAWAFGAKQRGVFLFMYKWRSVFIVAVCNIVFILGILFKTGFWGICDFFAGLKNKRFELQRMQKAKCLFFHVKALFRPSNFSLPWSKE
jgi:GT2 family glycosyltransferase